MLQLSCLSISARLASSQPAAPIIRVIEIIDDELLEDLAIAGLLAPTGRAKNWRPPPGTTATRTSSRGACGRSDAAASGRRVARQQLMDSMDNYHVQFRGRVIVAAACLATRRARE
jgi:hypothetical protein